jgi:hypothetical protein
MKRFYILAYIFKKEKFILQISKKFIHRQNLLVIDVNVYLLLFAIFLEFFISLLDSFSD